MGTTAEKGAYTLQTKSLLKDKINNLGGNITSETTFRQYANQLQNVYDNLPKTDYEEGSNITLSNCLKGKLDFEDGIVGYGDTQQTQYSGYNEMNTANATIGYKPEGTTITIDSKGVINASTNIGYASINLPSMALSSGTTYTFKRNFTGSYNSSLVDTNGETIVAIGYNKTSVTLTPESDITINKLNGALLSGDNYFWLYEGTTDKSFEPFVGNTASPNPSYPQEIEVVRGKNIINYTSTRQFVTNVKKGDTYTISLVGTSTGDKRLFFRTYNGDYSYSLDSFSEQVVLQLNGTRQVGTITSSVDGILYIRSGIAPINITIDYIQVEKGSQATSYLPFNTIEEVVGGKNLVNISNSESGGIDASGNLVVNSQNWRGTEFIQVKPNTQYTVSAIGYNSIDFQLRLYQYDENKNFISPRSQGTTSTPLTIITETNTRYLKWTIYLNNTSITTEIANMLGIMLCEGTSTTYEPYITPTSYQLSLGEYEFNGIGNYKDELVTDRSTGKWYKLKNVEKITFTGAEGESWSISSGNKYFFNNNEQYPRNEDGNSKVNTFSNYYAEYTFNTIYNTNVDYGFAFAYNANRVCIRNKDYSTVANFKTWLSTHNTIVYYPVATPTLTEITDTTLINQLENWYNAHSNNGTTIITSNGDLPMIIKVRGLKGE